MTQKTRRQVVAIQILIAFFALAMFGAGLFGTRMAQKMADTFKKSSEMTFDERMRPSIGKPYTKERHYKLLDLMRSDDDVITSSRETQKAAFRVMLDIGGLLALSSLASIFLLVKKQPAPKQAEDPRPS